MNTASINVKSLKSAIVRARECIGNIRVAGYRNLSINCNGSAVLECHGHDYSGRFSMPCDHHGEDFQFMATIDGLDGFLSLAPSNHGWEKHNVSLSDSGEIIANGTSQILSPINHPGNARFVRQVFPNDLHPAECEVNARNFIDAVKRVSVATDPENSRYALNGVRISWKNGKMELVATDSRRLHRETLKCSTLSEFGEGCGLIPAEALNAFVKSCGKSGNVTIKTDNHQFSLSSGECTIFGECTEGRFPRVEDVIPPAVNSFAVHPETALKAMKTLWTEFSDESRGVDIYREDSTHNIRAHIGDKTVDIGQGCSVAFKLFTLDLRYLECVLKSVGKHTVHLSTNGDESPIRFDSGDFMAIIMPLSRDK